MLEFAFPSNATGYYQVTITGSLYVQLTLNATNSQNVPQGGVGEQPALIGVAIGPANLRPIDLTRVKLGASQDFYTETTFSVSGSVPVQGAGPTSLYVIYDYYNPGIGGFSSLTIYKVTATQPTKLRIKPGKVSGYFS